MPNKVGCDQTKIGFLFCFNENNLMKHFFYIIRKPPAACDTYRANKSHLPQWNQRHRCTFNIVPKGDISAWENCKSWFFFKTINKPGWDAKRIPLQCVICICLSALNMDVN